MSDLKILCYRFLIYENSNTVYKQRYDNFRLCLQQLFCLARKMGCGHSIHGDQIFIDHTKDKGHEIKGSSTLGIT